MEKTAANCLVSYVTVPNYAIRKITSADGNVIFYSRPKDWGNYCEYQQRPGDVQEYRSCVLSCSGEHCNAATTTSSTVSTLALAAVTTAIIMLS